MAKSHCINNSCLIYRFSSLRREAILSHTTRAIYVIDNSGQISSMARKYDDYTFWCDTSRSFPQRRQVKRCDQEINIWSFKWKIGVSNTFSVLSHFEWKSVIIFYPSRKRNWIFDWDMLNFWNIFIVLIISSA